MPAVDTEGQFKFLLSCIKHSTAGKVSDPLSFTHSCRSLHGSDSVQPSTDATVPQVNFDNVAQELGIVSKAAA